VILPHGFVICKECRRSYCYKLWPACPSARCREQRGEAPVVPPSTGGAQ